MHAFSGYRSECVRSVRLQDLSFENTKHTRRVMIHGVILHVTIVSDDDNSSGDQTQYHDYHLSTMGFARKFAE
jgi:hypothetical protein